MVWMPVRLGLRTPCSITVRIRSRYCFMGFPVPGYMVLTRQFRSVTKKYLFFSAPFLPHVAVGGFNIVGKAFGVHKRRVFHALPQSFAKFSQPWQIAGKFDGNL